LSRFTAFWLGAPYWPRGWPLLGTWHREHRGSGDVAASPGSSSDRGVGVSVETVDIEGYGPTEICSL
jgi:hypothetical protein